MQQIDSTSTGDAERYLGFEQLQRLFAMLPPAPKSNGHVALIVRRLKGGRRETPERTMLTIAGGVPGDAWGRQATPNGDMQLAVMQVGVAQLLANGQPLPLFGDNLYLDLDLSEDNLPPGTRLRIGAATVQVTPMPHNGCRKFRSRFGGEALRFVSAPELRARHLRGIYMRVVSEGEVAPGDAVEVLSR